MQGPVADEFPVLRPLRPQHYAAIGADSERAGRIYISLQAIDAPAGGTIVQALRRCVPGAYQILWAVRPHASINAEQPKLEKRIENSRNSDYLCV
jgi:hypothetical protein